MGTGLEIALITSAVAGGVSAVSQLTQGNKGAAPSKPEAMPAASTPDKPIAKRKAAKVGGTETSFGGQPTMLSSAMGSQPGESMLGRSMLLGQ